MKRLIGFALLLSAILNLAGPVFSQSYIADYRVAKEELIRSIPVQFVDKARSELVIAYQHSSHGTHVSRGVFGLQDYKPGDETIFGVSLTPLAGKLEFRDYTIEDYAPPGVTAIDLDHQDETAFIQASRNYLDAPENATVNVVMWAWCSIWDHDVTGNYLTGMDNLISEYGPGGSKIGTGEGQREIPVTFIYMTGHPVEWGNTGGQQPKPQADLINAYCIANQQYCLDYYSIDTHAMDDSYWEDSGDDGDSDSYGGNFYVDWQTSHILGEHYFENKMEPEGTVAFGDHNTQHITANRKAYAMWWILARIAGWSDEANAVVSKEASDDLHVYPNPGSGRFFIENKLNNIESISVIDGLGREVLSISSPEISSQPSIDLTGNPPGVYGLRVTDKQQIVAQSKIILVQ